MMMIYRLRGEETGADKSPGVRLKPLHLVRAWSELYRAFCLHTSRQKPWYSFVQACRKTLVCDCPRARDQDSVKEG